MKIRTAAHPAWIVLILPLLTVAENYPTNKTMNKTAHPKSGTTSFALLPLYGTDDFDVTVSFPPDRRGRELLVEIENRYDHPVSFPCNVFKFHFNFWFNDNGIHEIKVPEPDDQLDAQPGTPDANLGLYTFHLVPEKGAKKPAEVDEFTSRIIRIAPKGKQTIAVRLGPRILEALAESNFAKGKEDLVVGVSPIIYVSQNQDARSYSAFWGKNLPLWIVFPTGGGSKKPGLPVQFKGTGNLSPHCL